MLMDKKQVKSILMSMRTPENEENGAFGNHAETG